MEVEVKINCKNKAEIEGYVTAIEMSNNKRPCLRFLLQHFNVAKNGKEKFDTEFPVFMYDDRAVLLSKWLRNGDIVEVECKARKERGEWRWIAVHVRSTKPIMRKFTVEEKNG